MLSDLSPGSPFWLPNGHPHLERAHHALAHLERRSRLHRGPHADPLRRGAVEAVGPLARVPRPHVLHGRGGQAHGPQAHELPRARADLQARPALVPGPARSATPSRASCTGTSRAARCTACCGSATSPRTTATCSAARTRSRRRWSAASTSASTSTTSSASSRASSCRRGRRSGSAPRRCGTRSEAALKKALEDQGLEYDLNEGDGAFYGPKIDLHMTDTIGRSWQLGTVQLDYYMPERFELTYMGADNQEHRPVMIHRALMGSFERFIGILIEHYGGEFPLWLAPVQALRAADRGPAQRLRARGGGPAPRGRHPGGCGRAHGVDREEDPRRRAPQGPVHARSWATRSRRQSEVAVRRHREGDLGKTPVERLHRFVKRRYTGPRMTRTPPRPV